MKTYQIELLEPKAQKLLEELVKLKLIKVREVPSPRQEFLELVSKIREKKGQKLDLGEITKEVEAIRKKRYEKRNQN